MDENGNLYAISPKNCKNEVTPLFLTCDEAFIVLDL